MSGRLFCAAAGQELRRGMGMAWFLRQFLMPCSRCLRCLCSQGGRRLVTYWLTGRCVQSCKRWLFGLQKGMFQAAKGGLLQGERASFIKRPAAARTPHGLQGPGVKMCARVKNIKNLIVLQKFRLTLQLKNTS